MGSYPAAFGNFISSYTVLTASISSSTNVSCYGGNNGSATVSASDGTPSYTYLWSTTPTQTTSTATGLTAGNYTVTVTDANGMSVTTSVTITQPAVLNISTSGNKTICLGNDTVICVYASGGAPPYHYLWSNNITSSCQTVSPISSTNYYISVTDNCTTTSSVLAVTVDSASKPVITQNVNILYSTAASSYQWNLNGNPIIGATGQYYAPQVQGLYSVTIIAANGCSAISDGVNFVGIDELNISLNTSVYPNPANENIIIESPQKAVIEIYNIQGQLIKTIVASSNKTSVNVSALPSSLYFVKVNTEKGVAVNKFVKE